MRAASWKAIRIPESTRAWRSWHAPIMPDSTTVATVFPPAASAASRTFSCLFSPTRFHEDPHFFLTQNRLPAKHPKEGDPCSQLARMFLTGCEDRGHTSRSATQRCWYPKQGPTYDFRFRSHATAQTKTHPVLEPH